MYDDEDIGHEFTDPAPMFRTKDGKLHESTADADRYIVAELASMIGPVVDSANRTLNPAQYIGPAAKLAIVDSLAGTPQRARTLKTLLNKIV